MKRALSCLLFLLLCASPALAQPALEAGFEDGYLTVRWAGCDCPQATLTIYRDGWPVMVTCVCGADGRYEVPSCYTQAAGGYAAQLRCYDGCVRAEAGDHAAPPAEEAKPTEVSTPMPATAAPTPAPTQIPTEVPTAVPTPRPTQRPTAAPTPMPTQTGSSVASLADEVVRQTNMEREQRGLPALRVDAELERAAAVRARELVKSFSHTRPDGSDWSTVSASVSGENIAKGHDSADRVMAAWMSSDGHRANILRSGFSRIGVCAYEAGGVLYWVQLFGA